MHSLGTELELGVLIPYVLTGLSAVMLWIFPVFPAWLLGFFTAMGSALYFGRISFLGALFCVLFLAAAYFYYLPRRSLGVSVVLGLSVVGLGTLLGTHLLPGFNNLKVFSNLQMCPDCKSFSLYLNFDKPLIGLGLIGFGYARIRKWADFFAIANRIMPIILFLCFVLLGASYFSGYVRWEPKLPEIAPIFLASNLIFTCFAEEAFFRGFIQRELSFVFRKFQIESGSTIALVVSSILFGMAHYKGGIAFMALASIAGAGYGYAYFRTRKLEASILTHFVVNAIHFVFFSYPALDR